jgi:hypothetical protein
MDPFKGKSSESHLHQHLEVHVLNLIHSLTLGLSELFDETVIGELVEALHDLALALFTEQSEEVFENGFACPVTCFLILRHCDKTGTWSTANQISHNLAQVQCAIRLTVHHEMHHQKENVPHGLYGSASLGYTQS